MIELIIRVATTDIEPCAERSCYNYTVYKLKSDKYGFDYIIERYDDVHDTPEYSLCTEESGALQECVFCEHGDPMPEGKFNTGGVYVSMHAQHCSHLFRKLFT